MCSSSVESSAYFPSNIACSKLHSVPVAILTISSIKTTAYFCAAPGKKYACTPWFVSMLSMLTYLS